MSDETLKPCPFCQGDAKLIKADRPSYTPHSEGWYVMCKCGASLGFHGNDNEYNTYGDFPHELCAIQAWNTRSVGTCDIEHVKGGARYDVWRCSACGYEYAESVSETSIVQNFCPNYGKKVVGE